MVSVDNAIFIHAIVPGHVETVCLLFHQKKDSPFQRRTGQRMSAI